MENRFNFRAYIKPYNKIYKVHSIENDGTFFAVQCFREDNIILKRNDDRTNLLLFTEGEFDLMQSTGLKDKNGKEIYEGDIIEKKVKYFQPYRFEKKREIVEWFNDDDTTGFYPFNDYNVETDRYNLPKDYEIIGNIYENKELIKE